MYFLMDDKPYYRRVTDAYDESDDNDDFEENMTSNKGGSSRRGAKSGMSNVETLKVAKQKFADLEDRLRSMESHVTSSRFELQRELRKISGEDA